MDKNIIINMKKIIYYIIIVLFAVNGVKLMTSSLEFTFWWWLGFFNLSVWGGYLFYKLLEYLRN